MPSAPSYLYGGSPNRLIIKFGGLALPGGQGTLGQIDLNDSQSWYVDPKAIKPKIDRHLEVGEYLYRAESAWLSDDFWPMTMSWEALYSDQAGTPWSTARARLLMAGEQQLTFDNLTYTLAKLQDPGEPAIVRRAAPLWYRTTLKFLCRVPWFTDLSASTLAATSLVNAPTAAPSGSPASGGGLALGTYTLQYTYVTASGETAASPASSNIVLSGSNHQISVSAVTPLPSWATAVRWYFASGPTTGFTVQNSGGAFTLNTAGSGAVPPASTPVTQFAIAYPADVFCRPTFTLAIPNTNTATITTATLTNAMTGEYLVAVFPGGLTPSTAYTITMDCGAWSIKDQNGVSYDMLGNAYPTFQPEYGLVSSNPFTILLATSSGVPTGTTIAASWSNRWLNP
jgi:hypothetical protein